MRWLVLVAALAACSRSSRAKPTTPPGPGRPQGFVCQPRPPGKPTAPYQLPVPKGGVPSGVTVPLGCRDDAECSGGKNGRCNAGFEGRGREAVAMNKCSYDACQSDSDCKGMGPCECGYTDGSRCLPGNCHVDADCKSGSCAEEQRMVCGGPVTVSYFCRTAGDTCTTNADCGSGSCVYVYDHTGGHWGCQAPPVCPTLPNG